MKLAPIFAMCCAVLFNLSSCIHDTNTNKGPQQGSQNLESQKEPHPNKQRHSAKNDGEIEEEQEVQEEEDNLGSKVKAVDDFFKVLDDIMN